MINPTRRLFHLALAVACAASLLLIGRRAFGQSATDPVLQNATGLLTAGRNTFRFDTFGDEAFWGDTLKLHQAIEGATLGGVGAGVSPATALAVGLKVDADALPASLVAQVQN